MRGEPQLPLTDVGHQFKETMSLYPLYLKAKVELKRLAIELRLIHPPHLENHGAPALDWPLRGINARYHGNDDSSPTHLVRCGISSPDQIDLLPEGKYIVLVETMDEGLAKAIGMKLAAWKTKDAKNQVVAIELGNEIDLTGASARDFNKFLLIASTDLRMAGFTGDIIAGGISRVRPDTIRWMKDSMAGQLADMIVGIHRYSIDNDATVPQDGYVNRDEECNEILKVANGRRIAVTEFGYPLIDPVMTNDIKKAVASTKVDLDYFRRMGVSYAMYYQWLNGPTNTPIDRFGIENIEDIKVLL